MSKKKTQKIEKTWKLGGHVYTDVQELAVKFEKYPYQPFYSLFVRTYATEDEVKAYLRSQDNLDEWAYIVHDKDVLEDGSPKATHIHLLLYRKQGFALTKLISCMSQNTLVQCIRSRLACYRYLTHKDNPEKHPYNDIDIKEYHLGGNNTFGTTQQEQREKHHEQMLDDLGQLSRRELAVKYGRDYMLNYQRYEAFVNVVREEELLDECNTLAEEATPQEELFALSSLSGDDIRLTLADYVCVQLREQMEGLRMPSASEIVRIYYEVLQKARDQRRRVARALHYNVDDVQVGDL